MQKKTKVDFHFHTNYSDGGTSLQEIFNKLAEEQVKFASITDHNTLEAYRHLGEVDTHGIKLVKGIEICVEAQGKMIHMLLYNFDENSPLFKLYLSSSLAHDKQNFLGLIAKLEEKGLTLDKEKVDLFINKNTYFDKYRLNLMLAEMGLCESGKEAHFLHTKDLAEPVKYTISAQQFFAIARESGAFTSIAHPMKYIKLYGSVEEVQKVILYLKEMGLDGVEVYNNRQDQQQTEKLLAFTLQNNLGITGGSDFHNKIGEVEPKRLGQALGEEIWLGKLDLNFDKHKSVKKFSTILA